MSSQHHPESHDLGVPRAGRAVARGITQHYAGPVGVEGLSAMYALPVRVKDGPRGLVYGAFRRDVDVSDSRVDAARETVRQFEFDPFVEFAARARLMELTRVAAEAYGPEDRVRSLLRDVHAELRHLCHSAGDGADRDRQEDLVARLEHRAAPGRTPARARSPPAWPVRSPSAPAWRSAPICSRR